jgi:hypothetical protein
VAKSSQRWSPLFSMPLWLQKKILYKKNTDVKSILVQKRPPTAQVKSKLWSMFYLLEPFAQSGTFSLLSQSVLPSLLSLQSEWTVSFLSKLCGPLCKKREYFTGLVVQKQGAPNTSTRNFRWFIDWLNGPE